VEIASAKAGAALEQDYLEKVLHLPHGTDMARATTAIGHLADIREFYASRLVTTVIDVPFALIFAVLMAVISPVLVWVSLGIGVLLIGLQLAFHGPIGERLLQHEQHQQQKTRVLSALLWGRDTVRQLASYSHALSSWEKVSREAANYSARLSIGYQLLGGAGQALFVLNSVLLLAFGVYQIHAGNLSVGGLVALSMMSARVLTPLAALGEFLAKLPKIQKEIKDLEKIVNQDSEFNGGADKVILEGRLRLADVSVTIGGYPALKDISFNLPQGEKLALIGASGAGKTTLLKALSLETPLSSGQLWWDDRLSTTLDTTALRRQIGIIEQHPYFFAGTIRENLCLGEDFHDGELNVALGVVGLSDFIKLAGRGLDLPISEGGHSLSGGQRQCLAIARMLVRQPPVVLMDEPTAMMDHAMEQKIVQALRFILKDKTLLLVTHRTPLLALVDKVAVIENGRITRAGDKQTILGGVMQNAVNA
jgi:ATP-binding cassette, subfamily C, bacterial LapB